jgi:hypothetical protein
MVRHLDTTCCAGGRMGDAVGWEMRARDVGIGLSKPSVYIQLLISCRFLLSSLARAFLKNPEIRKARCVNPDAGYRLISMRFVPPKLLRNSEIRLGFWGVFVGLAGGLGTREGVGTLGVLLGAPGRNRPTSSHARQADRGCRRGRERWW